VEGEKKGCGEVKKEKETKMEVEWKGSRKVREGGRSSK
jgi:hypothetical protein